MPGLSEGSDYFLGCSAARGRCCDSRKIRQRTHPVHFGTSKLVESREGAWPTGVLTQHKVGEFSVAPRQSHSVPSMSCAHNRLHINQNRSSEKQAMRGPMRDVNGNVAARTPVIEFQRTSQVLDVGIGCSVKYGRQDVVQVIQGRHKARACIHSAYAYTYCMIRECIA